jgi:membrane-bound ClpP family serine protease
MFMLSIIFVILAIGLILTVLELFFIPGTTLVGILGLIFTISAIVITFKYFGTETGWYVLIGSTLVKAGIFYWSFHVKAWTKFSLNTSIRSKVNEGLTDGLLIGATGITISTLRPSGKAEFNDRQVEVRTSGPYVENGTSIRITGINSNQIIVEPTN